MTWLSSQALIDFDAFLTKLLAFHASYANEYNRQSFAAIKTVFMQIEPFLSSKKNAGANLATLMGSVNVQFTKVFHNTLKKLIELKVNETSLAACMKSYDEAMQMGYKFTISSTNTVASLNNYDSMKMQRALIEAGKKIREKLNQDEIIKEPSLNLVDEIHGQILQQVRDIKDGWFEENGITNQEEVIQIQHALFAIGREAASKAKENERNDSSIIKMVFNQFAMQVPEAIEAWIKNWDAEKAKKNQEESKAEDEDQVFLSNGHQKKNSYGRRSDIVESVLKAKFTKLQSLDDTQNVGVCIEAAQKSYESSRPSLFIHAFQVGTKTMVAGFSLAASGLGYVGFKDVSKLLAKFGESINEFFNADETGVDPVAILAGILIVIGTVICVRTMLDNREPEKKVEAEVDLEAAKPLTDERRPLLRVGSA